MRSLAGFVVALCLASDVRAQHAGASSAPGGGTRDAAVGAVRVRITGTLEFPDGAPAEAVTVTCGTASTHVDAAGAFELEFLSALGTQLVLQAETRRVGARYLASLPLVVRSSTLAAGALVLTRTTAEIDFSPLVHPLNSTALAAGDFDGDGDVDFVANQGATGFVVLLNGTDGFEPHDENGLYVTGLRTVDVEPDGDLDLLIDHVLLPQGFTSSLCLNDGSGAFGPALGLYAAYERTLLADFDGDGVPDLVSLANGILGFRHGAGDGTFAPPVTQTLPTPLHTFTAAQLDADGVLDLVLHDNASLRVALGDGSGGFGLLAPLAFAHSAQEVSTGDVDGDGDADLVARTLQFNGGPNPTPYLEVLRGAGDGTFVALSPASGRKGRVVLGDLDGDGDDDLVQLETLSGSVSVGSVYTRRSLGDGRFATGVGYALGTSASAVALTDFDDDGALDVVVGSDSLAVLLGKGDTRLDLADFVSGAGSVHAVADHDGDGDLDLLLMEYTSGQVQLSRGAGSTTFVPIGPALTISHPLYSATGDLDGDGDLDVAVAHDTSVETLRTGATLSLQPLETLAVGSNPVPTLGDFDLDGDLDLAVSTWASSGKVYLYGGKGDGTLGPPGLYNTGGQPRTLVASDWNADGALDLCVQTQAPLQVVSLPGNGDGSFQLPTTYPAAGRLFGPSSAVDVNGDGHLDLLTQNEVLLGQGNGLFDPALAFGFTADASEDLDGDGRPDLLRTSFGAFELFPGLGDATFGARRLSLWPYEPFSTFESFPGDFDGDGDLDVLLDNDLHALRMRARRVP